MSLSQHSVAVEGQKWVNLEKNGIEAILVSKEAKFITQQHIQNPPESALGKKCYDYL